MQLRSGLKTVYSASSEKSGRDALEEFGKKWDEKHPMIYKSWEQQWDDLSEFFKYPPEIRRAMNTTNAIESLHYQLRKVSKNRSTFSTDDAMLKLLYLAVWNASKKWTMPIKSWGQVLNQFTVEARKRTGSVLMIFCVLHKKCYMPIFQLIWCFQGHSFPQG